MTTMVKLGGVALVALGLVAALAAAAAAGNQSQAGADGRRPAAVKVADCDDLKAFEPIKARIESLRPQVSEIVKYVLDGPGRFSAYDELAIFCDTFGPRMSGSKSLESAIDYLADRMKSSGLEVSEEPAMVPHWEALSYSAEIVAPVAHPMSILALGFSLSTNGTLEADVLLVRDFLELDTQGARGALKGKIVVFNYRYTNYPESVKFRTTGALRAAKYGAAAALVRSVTPFSINSPHAGAASKSIPTASITVEDANLIERWTRRNRTVRIRLNLQTRQGPDVKSRNLIGDIRGSSRPNEIVFVSGHTDSWYNTAGAMDDGGGMMISYKALEVLSKLKLRGARTMRAILWTAEEPGLVGAQQYFNDHKHELEAFKVVIESDLGTFRPLGWSHTNMGPMGQCIMQEALNLASRRVSTLSLNGKYEGSDIELFTDMGVPGLSLLNENSRYFDFHHTSGDTMDVEDPQALDHATALFASTLYVLANLDVDMRK